MPESTLDVRHLRTHFFTRDGVAKAVEDISFSLGSGEVLGLVGESGSGKTVTGFSILGLVDAPGKVVGERSFSRDEICSNFPKKKCEKSVETSWQWFSRIR